MDTNNTTTGSNVPPIAPPSTETVSTIIPQHDRALRLVVNISHTIVLILSLALICYISYDTFKGIPFLDNHTYMTFQFWVCVAFLLDFFIEFFISHDKKYYLKVRWFFFIISIPYLNIIHHCDIHLSAEMLFFIRFVPLVRGAYSLAMILGYVSHNRAVSLMTQYVAILLVLVYSLSLIFYYEEHGVNPDVKGFWDALYWAAMNTTTVGCYFAAVTPVGKVISVILPTAGMLMLPLFTVFVTSRVQAFDATRQRIELLFESKEAKKAEKEAARAAAKAAANAPEKLTSDSSTGTSQQS